VTAGDIIHHDDTDRAKDIAAVEEHLAPPTITPTYHHDDYYVGDHYGHGYHTSVHTPGGSYEVHPPSVGHDAYGYGHGYGHGYGYGPYGYDHGYYGHDGYGYGHAYGHGGYGYPYGYADQKGMLVQDGGRPDYRYDHGATALHGFDHFGHSIYTQGEGQGHAYGKHYGYTGPFGEHLTYYGSTPRTEKFNEAIEPSETESNQFALLHPYAHVAPAVVHTDVACDPTCHYYKTYYPQYYHTVYEPYLRQLQTYFAAQHVVSPAVHHGFPASLLPIAHMNA